MLTAYKRLLKQQPFHFSQITRARPIEYPAYEPASPQAEAFHKSTKKIRALFGGDRAAKTGTVAYEMIDKGMRKYPGDLFWSVALTGDLIAAIWEWHKAWLAPEEVPEDSVSWADKGRGIPREYRHPNGSIMEYKTAASRAGVFSAKKVRGIHIDEDPQRETSQGELIYNDCVSRVIQGGFICVSATPILGKNWMYNRIEKKQGDLIETWHVSLRENKFISDEEKDIALSLMSEDEIERRFYGRFTTLSGAVFKEWREDIHVLQEPPVIDASWRRFRAIDLGYENPFCCLWSALDDDGTLIFYDEYYQAQTLIKDHVQNINRITDSHLSEFANLLNFRPIEVTISDHERQTREELHACGIYTIAANKDVDLGIQAVNRRLLLGGNGKPRMLVSPRLVNLIRQAGNYHYKLVAAGHENKEVIDKVDDHAVDPARYTVMHVETGARNYTVMQ